MHPALGGIGYGSTIVAGLVGCYYNVIIAWCIWYLYSSFTVSAFCQIRDFNTAGDLKHKCTHVVINRLAQKHVGQFPRYVGLRVDLACYITKE